MGLSDGKSEQSGAIPAGDNSAGSGTGRAGGQGMTGAGFDRTDMDMARYRKHFEANYADEGSHFDDYDPAYRFGHELARNDEYRGHTWETLEPHARREWDARTPTQESTWERFKDAVRHGWETVYGEM